MTGTLLKRLEQHIWWSSQKHLLPPQGALRKSSLDRVAHRTMLKFDQETKIKGMGKNKSKKGFFFLFFPSFFQDFLLLANQMPQFN